jgi:hypothetical protein
LIISKIAEDRTSAGMGIFDDPLPVCFVDSVKFGIGESPPVAVLVDKVRTREVESIYRHQWWRPECAYREVEKSRLKDDFTFAVYREAPDGQWLFVGAVAEELLNGRGNEVDEGQPGSGPEVTRLAQ